MGESPTYRMDILISLSFLFTPFVAGSGQGATFESPFLISTSFTTVASRMSVRFLFTTTPLKCKGIILVAVNNKFVMWPHMGKPFSSSPCLGATRVYET